MRFAGDIHLPFDIRAAGQCQAVQLILKQPNPAVVIDRVQNLAIQKFIQNDRVAPKLIGGPAGSGYGAGQSVKRCGEAVE
jgi:hypothetical protein